MDKGPDTESDDDDDDDDVSEASRKPREKKEEWVRPRATGTSFKPQSQLVANKADRNVYTNKKHQQASHAVTQEAHLSLTSPMTVMQAVSVVSCQYKESHYATF